MKLTRIKMIKLLSSVNQSVATQALHKIKHAGSLPLQLAYDLIALQMTLSSALDSSSRSSWEIKK